jgi:spermidine synthase
MGWFFGFFFVSGFCSLLYEIVWLRLSMAQFGMTYALVSIMISIYMAGLGLGSWGAGYLILKYQHKITFRPQYLYAITELLIGMSAILVPLQFRWGRTLLEYVTQASSPLYYLLSGIWISLTLLPWCFCMGATFPIAVFILKNYYHNKSKRLFSKCLRSGNRNLFISYAH